MRPSAFLSRFGVALLATTAAAACGKEQVSSAGATGGTMIVDMGADAGDALPLFVQDESADFVTDLVFDHLAEIGHDLSTVGDKGFQPRLAKSWTWAPDSLSIAYSIDPRARWHDGQPVRASDVRYSYLIAVNPKTGSVYGPLLGNIDSVSVRDSLTAVIWFKKHTPEQFYDVAYQLAILPEHVYGKIPPEQLRTSEAARHPVGSGRFRFVSWQPGQRMELIADTANYRGRAKLDHVILSVVKDPQTAATQVLTAQADFYEAFPMDQVGRLDSSKVARAQPVTLLAYTFMAMNLRNPKSKSAPHPIFGDRAVRRALSMAVDREALLRNVFGKYGRISYGPFPRAMGVADSTLKLLPFDLARARALLDSAGWREPSPGATRVKNGVPLRFTISVPTSSLFRMRYAVLLQDQLKKAGAQVDIDALQGNTFYAKQFGGDFDAALIGFNTDPSITGSKQSWSTSGIGRNGQNNVSYSNPTVDALLDSSATAFDPAKAKAYASRAYQAIVDDAPAMWLYDVSIVTAVNKRITTAPMRADGWWSNLADWSIAPDKRIDRDKIGLTSAKP